MVPRFVYNLPRRAELSLERLSNSYRQPAELEDAELEDAELEGFSPSGFSSALRSVATDLEIHYRQFLADFREAGDAEVLAFQQVIARAAK